ncbi:MAG: hypothetical protein JWO03_1466 [Bacteroidetes bacterium]|nr:hypothetical protein [Bacteroidota bacterium]
MGISDSATGIIDNQSVYYYNAQNHVEIGYRYSGDGGTCNVYGDVFSMSAASFWNGVPHDSVFFGNANNSADEILISHSTHPQYDYGYSATGDAWTKTLTNFSVLGRIFPKVYLSTGTNAQIYHVDNIGVVRWVFNDTINGQRTWNLLRYHVINP